MSSAPGSTVPLPGSVGPVEVSVGGGLVESVTPDVVSYGDASVLGVRLGSVLGEAVSVAAVEAEAVEAAAPGEVVPLEVAPRDDVLPGPTPSGDWPLVADGTGDRAPDPTSAVSWPLRCVAP